MSQWLIDNVVIKQWAHMPQWLKVWAFMHDGDLLPPEQRPECPCPICRFGQALRRLLP